MGETKPSGEHETCPAELERLNTTDNTVCAANAPLSIALESVPSPACPLNVSFLGGSELESTRGPECTTKATDVTKEVNKLKRSVIFSA